MAFTSRLDRHRRDIQKHLCGRPMEACDARARSRWRSGTLRAHRPAQVLCGGESRAQLAPAERAQTAPFLGLATPNICKSKVHAKPHSAKRDKTG